MAMVGCMGAGMEVVDGMHAEQSQRVGCMTGDGGALTECEVNTLMAPVHTVFHVRSSM